MLKDIIKRCSYLLNRNDILRALDDADEIDDITDDEIKLDVIKLIDYYNTVVCSVFENYLELVFSEKILSSADSKICYERFSKMPVKVISVETELNNQVKFTKAPFCIFVPKSKELYNVTYRFVPKKVKDLGDKVECMPPLYRDIICYGILGEFLAGTSKYSESIFWKEKFTSEIFNLKTKKERRVKSTYCVWNKI